MVLSAQLQKLVLLELFDLIVTPGIRLESDSKDDQRNTTTPEKAIELAVSYTHLTLPTILLV